MKQKKEKCNWKEDENGMDPKKNGAKILRDKMIRRQVIENTQNASEEMAELGKIHLG